ncbi:MAG: tRNA (N6-isopentenyl adenosine(37)-C2)-methylthiotransferase MiaB [Paracoccaceae bacterium]|nr:tRNA (N6-isopentenyl adenosine(37)-C2)-methylthiotransferase MiaB [Paracoccaceae bacterium]
MTKKLFIKTHGCQMNEYDSSRISDLMGQDEAYVMADCEEEADVLLLNTCSIREKAQEKVFHQLGRWRKLKDHNPDLVIGVGGCVATQEGENIRKRANYVDVVFGPQTIHRLPDMVTSAKSRQLAVVDVTFPELEKFDSLPEPGLTGPSAFVSIMEGCSKYCSFCVVPYTRGEEISRPVESIMKEVISLTNKGAKEIHLLGQNVNAYRGRFGGGEVRLSELLHYISELPEVGRIRYTTSHPMEFGDDLIEAYAELPKLVSHLHLPVQSGSNAVLKAMKRGHTIDVYKDKIARLREIRPNISMSSDFIVGFPGETEADFMETLRLVKDIKYGQSYSFKYSARPGTPAASREDVCEEVKKERLAELQLLLTEQQMEIQKSMIGKEVKVLFEKPGRLKDQMGGKSEYLHAVHVIGKSIQKGDIKRVKIINSEKNSLGGILIEI